MRIYLLKTILLVIILCSNNQTANAQDLREAIRDLRSEYELTDELHIVMQINVYADSNSLTPFYKEKADIRKSKNNYLYRFGNNDLLMTNNYLIMVDREAREIVCSKRTTEGEKEFGEMFQFSVDSILSLYGSSKYLGREKSIDHYRIFQKNGPIGQIDLFFKTDTKLLHRLEYHYLNKQYITILFEIFDAKPAFGPSMFDEEKYVIVAKDHLKSSEAFADYQIIDAIQE